MSVIPPSEVEFVERAAKYLENPSFLVRVADLVGVPLEGLLKLAPQSVSDAVTVAVRRALDFSLATIPTGTPPDKRFRDLEDHVWWTGYRHAATSALLGGAGGAFGMLGLLVELPVTTCLMVRSMSAIARAYGEDVRQVQVRLECLSLFATGGPSSADDEMDASYLAVRGSLATLVRQAAKFVAHTPAQEVMMCVKNGTAPTLVKLIGKISRGFDVTVSEKLMAQSIPVVGAIGGATVNVCFAEHFNTIARYHFGLRHLERRWGMEAVRAIYCEAAARHPSRNSSFEPESLNFGYRGSDLQSAVKPR